MPAVVFTDQEARDVADGLEVAIAYIKYVGEPKSTAYNLLAERLQIILAKITED
jgi:hypothetical protein